eukprot:scaffold64764_cov66-Phaeocystis_antarctica.AAC.3
MPVNCHRDCDNGNNAMLSELATKVQQPGNQRYVRGRGGRRTSMPPVLLVHRVRAALLGDEGSEVFGRLQELDAFRRSVSPLGELPLVLFHRDHLSLAVGRLRQLGDQLAHALRDLLPGARGHAVARP